jgi:hypothetical protein
MGVVAAERLPLLGVATSTLPSTSVHNPYVYPEPDAGFFTRVTFAWLSPLLQHGARMPLQLPDLWAIQEQDETINMRNQLVNAMSSDHEPTRALWQAIRRAFGWNMYVAGICKLCGDLLGFVGPICINCMWLWSVYDAVGP